MSAATEANKTVSPGRERSPSGAPRSVWKSALGGVWQSLDEKNISLISAGVAFYGMLAIFPGVAAVIALWGYFADPAVIESQVQLLARFVPVEAFQLIDDQVERLIIANNSALGWASVVSIGAALWSTRAGVAALIIGLNTIYRERHRTGVMRIIAAFLMTTALIVISLFALAAVVILPVVLAFLPLGPLAGMAVELARWLITAAIMISGLGFIYRYGPNRRGARLGWISPGAIVAVVIWGVVSIGFSYYLSNFGNYNEVYGSIGAVIALLFWLYISAFAVLLGATLNAELELRTKPDSTIGPDRPMGKRGATVADEYVDPDAEPEPADAGPEKV